MPKCGYICMVTEEKVTFEECLECSKSYSRCDFTPPMLRGMVYDAPRSEGISITNLSSCVRKLLLMGKERYWTKPQDDWYSFRGRLAHAIVENQHGNDNAIVEEEFGVEMAGLWVIGHPDVVYPDQGLIVDYKSTTFVPKDGKHYGSHEAQLNCYRYLVEAGYFCPKGKPRSEAYQRHIEIGRLVLAYFDMKRPKRVEVEVWPLEKTENYIKERVAAIAEAYQYDELPEPACEKWECDFCSVEEACKGQGSSLMTRIGRQMDIVGAG